MMSNESKVTREESPKDSPDTPKHKKIKIDEEATTDNMDSSDNSSAEIIKVKQEAAPDDNKSLKIVPIYVDENGRAHHEGTTAYTTNLRDKTNILIIKKDSQAYVKICSWYVKRNSKTKSTWSPPDKASTSIADKRGDKTYFGGVERHVAIHKRLLSV